MLILQGNDPIGLSEMQYADHLHWYPGLFSTCGVNASKISEVVNNTLGGIIVNNLANAQVLKNDATDGLDIRYGVTANSPIDLYYPSVTLASLAMLRFGPVKKPTSISVDLKAIFAVGLRECFMVLALCGSTVYSLFNLYQGTVDGNYGYGRNGVWCNNATTRLKKLSSTTTYTGTLAISSMPNCFTSGETTCNIAIVRLQQAYWEGNGAGMRNASTLYIKNLEIV